ncbi:MAG: CPBP family intramembrane glutamic endopeptidase [Candidatus Cryptobacteroides sp.]|jgi:membrane protease YdiL (CAAX protease family)
MKNSERIIYGLLLTAVAFLAANLSGRLIKLNINFLPDSFVSDTAMLLFAILLICVFKKHVNYRIAWPKFKNTLKPILFGILAAVIVNSLIYGIGMSLGIEQESHYIFAETSPLQFFLFVFICASVAEELLFRGFLQNILKPLQNKGIKLFKRHISLPVIISALAFSLAHLCLIASGAGAYFLFRTLTFTFVLGLIAGYYQEKYDNNAYAIIVHMSGNLMGLIASIMLMNNI